MIKTTFIIFNKFILVKSIGKIFIHDISHLAIATNTDIMYTTQFGKAKKKLKMSTGNF